MNTWQDVLQLDGFSSALSRAALNKAVATVDRPRILEVGSYCGSTAVALCFGHDVESIHLVDNHSEFGNTRDKLASVAERFGLPATIHDCNFFTDLTPETFGGTKFNVYHYDGPHEEAQHAAELAIAWPHLDDKFLYIVDDYSWDQVRRGCDAGMKALAGSLNVVLTAEHKSDVMNDTNGYWNGLFFAWCEKVRCPAK